MLAWMAEASPCFPPRHVQTLSYKLSPDELKLYDAVTEYVQQNFQRADKVNRGENYIPDVKDEELRGLVKEVMPASLKLDVPLKVDVKIGRNWADMESA